MSITREDNIKLYRRLRADFQEDYQLGARFEDEVREACAKLDGAAVLVNAAIIASMNILLEDVQDDAEMEAYQDDIDSGWAAERAATAHIW